MCSHRTVTSRLAFTLCTVDIEMPVSLAISLMEFFPFLRCLTTSGYFA